MFVYLGSKTRWYILLKSLKNHIDEFNRDDTPVKIEAEKANTKSRDVHKADNNEKHSCATNAI